MTRLLEGQKEKFSFLLLLLMIVVSMGAGLVWNMKHVTVFVDGESHIIKTYLNSPKEIVEALGVTLSDKDAVTVNTAEVKEGSTLTVVRAFPVKVQVDGTTTEVMTVQPTAQALAEELGYTMPHFAVVTNGGDSLTKGSSISIATITSSMTKIYDRAIPVQETRIEDASLPAGYEVVESEGREGAERVEEVLYFSHEKLVKQELAKQKVLEPMQPRQVRVGTAAVDSISAEQLPYRYMMTMEATAYLPTDGGGDGITASGMMARRGVVAVDPNVIPLGTTVFIPGYGMAIAGDTGGDIVGHRIDLVMEDYGEAIEFGRRTIEVYVL